MTLNTKQQNEVAGLQKQRISFAQSPATSNFGGGLNGKVKNFPIQNRDYVSAVENNFFQIGAIGFKNPALLSAIGKYSMKRLGRRELPVVRSLAYVLLPFAEKNSSLKMEYGEFKNSALRSVAIERPEYGGEKRILAMLRKLELMPKESDGAGIGSKRWGVIVGPVKSAVSGIVKNCLSIISMVRARLAAETMYSKISKSYALVVMGMYTTIASQFSRTGSFSLDLEISCIGAKKSNSLEVAYVF